ncbi:MAG: CYTH domain-containing protein [Lachnospiraceae bacterium]|nr:CYTH domain-containing protein [Lachnospiraceae bacterium]
MEIERKWLLKEVPTDLEKHPCHIIEQAYLNTRPVVRVRRQDDTYYLTYKGGGMMAREEYNLPLDAESYAHLRAKADGKIISKKRYVIPLPDGLVIELDHFTSPYDGLYMAEIEFESVEQAEAYVPPAWFGQDVTYNPNYHNSVMSQM